MVRATDSRGCTATDSVVVAQPSAVTLTSSQVNITCYGGSDGSIDLAANGGTSPYTYRWSNNATTEDISNLTSGTYSVTVTDTNGCSRSQTLTLVQPPSSVNLSATVVNSGCATSGSIDLSVTGGYGQYSYLWSNSATTQDISGLSASTYSVTVTDSVGGAATATFGFTAWPMGTH